MELKTLAKFLVILSAVVSVTIGLAVGLTFGNGFWEVLLITFGVSTVVYLGFVLVSYFVGNMVYISLSKDTNV
jgi:hypothetical protein